MSENHKPGECCDDCKLDVDNALKQLASFASSSEGPMADLRSRLQGLRSKPAPAMRPPRQDVVLQLKVEGKKGERVQKSVSADRLFKLLKKVTSDTGNNEAVLVRDFGGDEWRVSLFGWAKQQENFNCGLTKDFSDASSLGCGVSYPIARTLVLDLEFLEDATFTAHFIGVGLR